MYPYDKKYFERVFKKPDPWGLSLSEFQKNKYLKQIGIIRKYFPHPKSILEIGCAAGTYTVMLAEAFPDAKIVGIDIAHNAIKMAEEKCKKYKNTKLIEGDIIELLRSGRLPKRDFDIVVQSESLYYLFPRLVIQRGLGRYLGDLIGALRNDGVFVTSNAVSVLLRPVMGIYYFLLSQPSNLLYSARYTDWNEVYKRSLTYDLKVFKKK